MKFNCIIALFLLLTGRAEAQDTQPSAELAPGNAEQYLIKRVDPQYPPLAKAAKLQETVVLRITVSREGRVTSVTPVSGQQMFVQAATEAVRKWEYRGVMVDGHPSGFSTTVEVPFTLDPTVRPFRRFQEESENYNAKAGKCRGELLPKRYTEAEKVCIPLIDLSQKMASSERDPRFDAYRLVGFLFAAEQKHKEALLYYENALAITESPELDHRIATELQAIGDLPKAQMYYERELNTLESDRQSTLGEQRSHLSEEIASVLKDYAMLLRKAGKEDAAKAAEEKAQSLSVSPDHQ